MIRRAFLATSGLCVVAPLLLNAKPTINLSDPDALYAEADRPPAIEIAAGAGVVRVVIAQGSRLDLALVEPWVRSGIAAVTAYFGTFPLARYTMVLIESDGARVGPATTFGHAGAVTRFAVGRDTTAVGFARDWVLVHEMMHAVFPDLPRRALWLQEGNATWIEPVARVQAGQILDREIWEQAIVGMPKGDMQPGSAMDGTERWGHLYWGGATFWLMAEIEIFDRTGGSRVLRDAMRAICSNDAGIARLAEPEDVMRAGDAAIGSRLLEPLYLRFAGNAPEIDLPALFAKLGVSGSGASYREDQSAPLAALRERIGKA